MFLFTVCFCTVDVCVLGLVKRFFELALKVGNMEKFFGGPVFYVILRLAVISLVLGVVLSAFDLDAFALVQKLRELIRYVYDLGFDAFIWIGDYFLLGAVIVFPIWLVLRLIAAMKPESGETTKVDKK